jgi:hypothetical protein
MSAEYHAKRRELLRAEKAGRNPLGRQTAATDNWPLQFVNNPATTEQTPTKPCISWR